MSGQTQTVIQTILQSIDAGELNPGDVVQEDALINALGISRTPMREALIQLEASGLVQRQSRKGAVIFKPTLEEFLGILEVHAHLEGQAAGLAARRLSVERGKLLEKAVCDCEDHQRKYGDENPDKYYQLNLQFHKTIAEAAGNPFLLELVKSNARKLMAYYRARYKFAGAIADSALDHREIANLIVSRKSEEAQKAMIKHVEFDQLTVMDLLAALG
jgi:DNA-binding GntR family transcriptional regulator